MVYLLSFCLNRLLHIQVRVSIIGPRGSSVVLHLRRFMPNTGDFSHVFRTRIRRDFPLQAISTKQHGSTVQIRTRDMNVSRPDHSYSFAEPHINGPLLDPNMLADSHVNIDVSHQSARVSKVQPSHILFMPTSNFIYLISA